MEVISNAITVPITVEAAVIPVALHISLLAKIAFHEARVNSTGTKDTAFIFTAFLELKDSASTDNRGTMAISAITHKRAVMIN